MRCNELFRKEIWAEGNTDGPKLYSKLLDEREGIFLCPDLDYIKREGIEQDDLLVASLTDCEEYRYLKPYRRLDHESREEDPQSEY